MSGASGSAHPAAGLLCSAVERKKPEKRHQLKNIDAAQAKCLELRGVSLLDSISREELLHV
eukprot:6923396-Alexandrium_andersonii.AAC.1